MIFNDVEWKDEIMLMKYQKNMRHIVNYKIALENYENFMGVVLPKCSELDDMWHKKEKTNMTADELFTLSQTVVDGYKNLVKEVGKENFIFQGDNVEFMFN